MAVSSLLLQTSSVVEGANTFISLEDANQYFEDRLYTDNWDSLSDDDKNRSLINSYRVLLSNINFCPLLPSSEDLPIEIGHAQCEQAIYLAKENRFDDSDFAGISSVKVGSIDIESDRNTVTGILAPEAVNILSRFLTTQPRILF